MIRYILGAVLLIGVLYGAVEGWPLIVGPRIYISTPTDYANVPGGILEVRGVAKHASGLTLNGTPVLYDQNGAFSSTMTLPRGGSILTVVATDRFGRSATATRNIFVP